MSYLVCDKCTGYYELQPDESPNDFSYKCECGGTLKYKQNLNDNDDSQKTCTNCGSVIDDDKKICPDCSLNGTSLTGKFESKHIMNQKEFNLNWLAMSIAIIVTVLISAFGRKYLFHTGVYSLALFGGLIAGYIVGKSKINGIINGGIAAGLAGFIISIGIVIFGSKIPSLSNHSPILTLIMILQAAIVFFIIFSIIGTFGGLLGSTIKKS